MTRRPADIPPEVWARMLMGQAERLERAWLRLYCVAMPRPYRRRFLWTAGWGPVGLVLFLTWGAMLRVIERGSTDDRHP